jgi:hypothetical protein
LFVLYDVNSFNFWDSVNCSAYWRSLAIYTDYSICTPDTAHRDTVVGHKLYIAHRLPFKLACLAVYADYQVTVLQRYRLFESCRYRHCKLWQIWILWIMYLTCSQKNFICKRDLVKASIEAETRPRRLVFSARRDREPPKSSETETLIWKTGLEAVSRSSRLIPRDRDYTSLVFMHSIWNRYICNLIVYCNYIASTCTVDFYCRNWDQFYM